MQNLYNQPIVLDNGSGTIRCGFSGDESPRVCYSNIIGRPKYNKIGYLPNDIHINDTFIGNDAQLQRGILKLQYPMEHGNVVDWNNLELVWQHVLMNDLLKDKGFDINEHSILITDQPFSSRRQREQMCEIMFETFNVGAVNFGISSVLSLYSTGRTTGVSVDIGDGVSTVACVYEGFALPGCIKRVNLAGRDITNLLKIEVMKNGYLMNSSSEFEILRSMKERLCFVNESMVNVNTYSTMNEMQSFPLPDGKKLNIATDSLSRPCELLFQPQSFGYEEDGIHQLIYDSIMNADTQLRGKFFESIVLSGGSTSFRNFGPRLLKELRNLDSEVKLKMYASAERKNNCFIGASILSSLSTFNNLVVDKKQFAENPSCVHDKYY